MLLNGTKLKRLLKIAFAFILFCILITWWSDYRIRKQAEDFCNNDLSKIPACKSAIVLGTAKFLSNGSVNLYYQYRIDATLELFRAGKIKYVIISGDHGSTDYNEPQTFKEDLVKGGIPDSLIYLDYAGFRTFDSIIRGKEIFEQDTFIVVSQKFHNERAIYIGAENKLTVYGYNAKDVSKAYGLRTNAREKLARVKTMLDLHLLNTKPRYLGEKIVLD